MKCKSKQFTVFDSDGLKRKLSELEAEEQNPELYSDPAKMKKLGMNPEEFATYLMLHKYGAPPHGGLGIGLERLTMHLLGAKNVREATMFPRDINRVSP